MGLEQLIQDGPTGLVKGYMGGATAGTDMRSKLAQAAFTDTQRNKMEQMMPHEVETARIANLPGQAQEQAGFYEQDAQTKTEQSKVSALQAQQALRQMPERERREMADSIKQQSLDAVSQLSKMLRGGAPVADAIAYAEQQYPAAAKDPSWKAQAQKYLNMPPDQAANEVDMLRHKIANTDFLAQMEGQKAVALKDMDNTAAMERTRYTADAGVRSAQIGAESRASSSTQNQTEILNGLFEVYNSSPIGSPEREQARKQINLIKGGKTVTKEGLLGPQSTTTEFLSKDPVGNSEQWSSWDNKKRLDLLDTLRKHPDQIDRASQMFNISAEWLRQQTQKGK